jgi:fructan beta-fructosidase
MNQPTEPLPSTTSVVQDGGGAAIDAYRPHFHFSPPTGWMNDPNGFVFFEGEYHLFYQHLLPRHWGHAVSPDLIHWEHLPIALEPDELGEIWSGSAVVDWHDTSGFFGGKAGLVAIFTHWLNGRQQQSIAYSTDLGRTWTKYAGNPVIPNEELPDFRDPKVLWHAPTARWVMVVAAGQSIRFYTSPDLKTWTFTSAFDDPHPPTQSVWECPDLFVLPVEGVPDETRWVLFISIGSAAGWTMQYFAGRFDGTTFQAEQIGDTPHGLEYGSDCYAAQSCSDVPPEDGRRLVFGWMGNWAYSHLAPTGAWQGAMTIPREFKLKRLHDRLYLIQEPVAELQTLRGQARRWAGERVSPGTNLLAEVRGTRLEIIAKFTPGDAEEFGFRVRVGEGEQTTIGYRVETARLFVDRTESGVVDFESRFAACHEAPLEPTDGQITMHIFVDHSSVEVFGGAGEVAITNLVFPKPGSDGVELYTVGGEVVVQSLEVYTLGSVEAPRATSQA